MKRRFSKNMRQISGFGGEYEEACKKMVLAGLDWLDNNPSVNITDESFEEKISKVFSQEVELPSGAMVSVCTNHIVYAHKNGWDEYVKKMQRLMEII